MASNYEYDSMDNGEYGGSPDHSEGEHAVYEMPSLPFIVLIIEMFLIIPIILIANLVLFIKIVGNKKIRSEPWRWLIAHASVCIFIKICFVMADMFGVQSWMSSASMCSAIIIMHHMVCYMSIVSVVLVVTERFHALRLGNENEGGMTKKAVILTLVILWVLLIIAQMLPMFIMAEINGVPAFLYIWNEHGPPFCYVGQYEINSIILMALTLWALLTFIVAIIGMVVLRNRKTTTEPMKKSIITPTLAVSSIALVFLAICNLLQYLFLVDEVRVLIPLLKRIHEIAFPIIWLVTWSRNQDISLKCGGGDDGEHIPLLEEK